MIDHVTLTVRDFKKSKEFYEKVLRTLGMKVLMGEEGVYCGFGKEKAYFWIAVSDESHPISKSVHLAFSAESRNLVDEFYKAALAAGGKDNGAPGIRKEYSPDYYAAFVLDLDGNNIEAVNG